MDTTSSRESKRTRRLVGKGIGGERCRNGKIPVEETCIDYLEKSPQPTDSLLWEEGWYATLGSPRTSGVRSFKG